MARDLTIGLVIGLSIGCVFGALFIQDESPKIDPYRTQQILDEHLHDITELIKAVEALEVDVDKLKKGKR